MSRFPRAPYTFRAGGNANEYTILGGCRWVAAILFNGELTVVQQESLACAISSLPDLYAAVDAADTAFAVLNVQDLGSQARACVREAWPLVQQARAKVDPEGTYASVVREAQEHEIARLDGIIKALSLALDDIIGLARAGRMVHVENRAKEALGTANKKSS